MKNNLVIYNTLSGKKDLFKPIKSKSVKMFVCGPTVYDYGHLGHAKLAITFDAFAKYLKHSGYKVSYIQNITDVDDKIIARAREMGVSPKDLATAFTKEWLKDMKALNVNSVSKYPKATLHIKEIISQVKRLLDKGYAYEIKDDGVYFDISKFKNYGKLSGRTALQAEDAVSRVDYSRNKKNRGDFCLWKLKQQEEEPSWPSPFGEGRPGWHIEDTSITEKYFGPQYDIHGGAIELIFPHHEAEVTQMEAVSGKSPMVKYWMHVGFLTVNGNKMSKSLGNFITIRDFLKRCSANYLRFYFLRNLWSSPMDYSESAMIDVKSAVSKIEEFLRKLKFVKNSKSAKEIKNLIKNFKNNFYKELADDFNTPKAFAEMFEFVKQINILLLKNNVSKKDASEIYKIFQEIDKVFGFIDFEKVNKKIPEEIKKLAKAREDFRKKKEWQKADEARNEMEKRGYTIEDTKDGPVVKIL